jgi:nucleotide-binding universal stress UspA family protein
MPELEEHVATRRIVVGVDGSEGSTKALNWAIGEATRSSASLELVTAWLFPMALGYVFAKWPDEVREQVQRIAVTSVSHVEDVAPEVVVRSVLHEGEAGPTLVDLSTGRICSSLGREDMATCENCYLVRSAPTAPGMPVVPP